MQQETCLELTALPVCAYAVTLRREQGKLTAAQSRQDVGCAHCRPHGAHDLHERPCRHPCSRGGRRPPSQLSTSAKASVRVKDSAPPGWDPPARLHGNTCIQAACEGPSEPIGAGGPAPLEESHPGDDRGEGSQMRARLGIQAWGRAVMSARRFELGHGRFAQSMVPRSPSRLTPASPGSRNQRIPHSSRDRRPNDQRSAPPICRVPSQPCPLWELATTSLRLRRKERGHGAARQYAEDPVTRRSREPAPH